MMRRAFVAVVVGVTAALLVGLASVSLASEIGGTSAPAIRTMGISLGGVVGMATAGATLLLLGQRRRQGALLYVLSTILSVAFLAWASQRVPSRPTLVLAASDHDELREFHDEAHDARGIEHPTLGFRLPHPTLALEPSTEIVDQTRAIAAPHWGDAHQLWAFETHDRGVSVVLDLSRAEHADRASLDALDHAVTGPLEAAGHAVHRTDPTGLPGCLRERLTADLSNGGRVDAVLFTFDDGARSLRLVVTVVSDGTGDWAGYLDGVSLACEREPS